MQNAAAQAESATDELAAAIRAAQKATDNFASEVTAQVKRVQNLWLRIEAFLVSIPAEVAAAMAAHVLEQPLEHLVVMEWEQVPSLVHENAELVAAAAQECKRWNQARKDFSSAIAAIHGGDAASLRLDYASKTVTEWEPKNNANIPELFAEWLTGQGPRHQSFHTGDPMLQDLRKHDNVKKAVQSLSAHAATHQLEVGHPVVYNYSLSGLAGAGEYLRDYSAVLTDGATGNLAAAFLGSYKMTATPTKINPDGTVKVEFHVENISNVQSATHPPVIGWLSPA